MTQRIDGPGVQHAQARAQDSAAPQQAEGHFMGEVVRVDQDALSLVQDAAEELTFSASEDVERKLTERKDGKEKGRGIEHILFYVDKTEDMNRSDLESLLKQLGSIKNARNADVLALVRQAFKDPTNQHAALSYAQAQLDELDLPLPEKISLRNALGGALRELEATEGRAINAGYNVAGVDAPGLGLPPSSLRILYRDTIIDFESYEKTFSGMLQKFGPEEFPKAVDYLIRALGNDMTAMTPSSPSAQLKEVMDGLYMVESLGTVYTETGKVLRGAAERHGEHAISEREVIEPLLRYKDAPHLVSAQISNEMPFLVTDSPARDAELTQGVREIARRMPHKLYASADTRLNLLNTFQELLDDAVDREEMSMEE